jgi:hypothetical protein
VGEITDVVNSGVSVIKLVANHAGSHTQDGQFANGLPAGVEASALANWTPHNPVGKIWKQRSDWYEFWNVDMDFTVAMKWFYNGSLDNAGKFVDQVTVTLDVRYLPPDFTLDVTANFPPRGLKTGDADDPVGVLAFTTVVELNGFLGQLVAWKRSFDCEVYGDGNWKFG